MPSSFPAIFYTSGTPITVGQRDCAYRRWLGYHAGAYGTGWRRKATAVPLATGASVHKGIELIAGWLINWQTGHPGRKLSAAPIEVIAWAAIEAATRYEDKARAKGLLLTMGDDDAERSREQLIMEQRTLVESLVWIWGLVRLPIVLSRYRILASEAEETLMLNCTCGLGEAIIDEAAHAARRCEGICVQGKADLLLEAYDGSGLAYEEVKTKASERKAWEDAWEHSGQLLVNMEAASRRLGAPVNSAFVTVLYKGWRGRDKGDPPTAPKYQHSPLVWPWFDPGAPPMREPNWAGRYKWFDDMGGGHTLPRSYKRAALWQEDLPIQAVRPGASRVESFIRTVIVPEQYAEFCRVLGPFPRPATRVPKAIEAIRAEENRWQNDVIFLRERGILGPADVNEGLSAENIIARSWNCTGYDGTPCEFRPVCFEEPGWQDPAQMGIYEFRTPHHSTERHACEALGVVFPEAEDEDDGADD